MSASSPHSKQVDLLREGLDFLYHHTPAEGPGRSGVWSDAHKILNELEEQLEASPTEREMRCFARVLDPDRYPLPGDDFTDIINEALHALKRVMPLLDASSPANSPHEHTWSLPGNSGVYRCMTCGVETTDLGAPLPAKERP